MTDLVQPAVLLPGIHMVDAHVYHADPCATPSLSASIARVIVKDSPLHAWAKHPRLNPQTIVDESKSFDVGTAAHELLLEGGMDRVEVFEFDDWRKKAAQEARDECRARGLTPLLRKDWDQVEQMVIAANVQLDANAADPRPFTDGLPEQTIIWEDNGVLCRALVDWLHDDFSAVDDYKTAVSANPEKWCRGSLFDNGYDVQAAFYLRGIEKLTGYRPEWRWVVQEKQPPYALTVVAPQPGVIELADAKVDYAIGKWRECLAANRWPGYPTEVCWAELRPWEETRWLEKEARES